MPVNPDKWFRFGGDEDEPCYFVVYEHTAAAHSQQIGCTLNLNEEVNAL